MKDQLQKLVFSKTPVRGAYVTLDATWHEIVARHDYPAPVRTLLGQMCAAAALLSSSLKFDGALVLQMQGNGPVRLLVVECNSDLAMRATAKLRDDAPALPAGATLAELVNPDGTGRCVITLDPHDKHPGQQSYQGIVPLSDAQGTFSSVSTALEHYMRASEQIDTRIWVDADDQHAKGLMLQKVPQTGGNRARNERQALEDEEGQDADAWNRVTHLGATLGPRELLDTRGEALLHRLFWQENPTLPAPGATRFSCSCSRERVGAMLRMLGQPEIEEIIAEQGEVEVHCEFCNQRYAFDAVDAAQVFSGLTVVEAVSPPSSARH